MWPFNRGWPLNGGPLNRGLTVVVELYLSTLTPSTVAEFHGGRVDMSLCQHV
jgi:hypothetical protein